MNFNLCSYVDIDIDIGGTGLRLCCSELAWLSCCCK